MIALGQVRLVLRPHLGDEAPKPVEYPCPINPPANIMAPSVPIANDPRVYDVSVDPTLNCMRDARGNAICSDGSHYPPGCPHTPDDKYFTPGITPDVTSGSRIEGKIPSPRVAGTTGGEGGGLTPLVIGGGLAAAAAAVGAFFYFR